MYMYNSHGEKEKKSLIFVQRTFSAKKFIEVFNLKRHNLSMKYYFN